MYVFRIRFFRDLDMNMVIRSNSVRSDFLEFMSREPGILYDVPPMVTDSSTLV